MKKFTQNDIFVNTIKTYPKVRFFANDGNIYYNDTNKTGVELGDFLQPEDIVDSIMLTEAGDILITETGDVLIIEELY